MFYPDQCIHWAIMQQIEPLLMRGMYEFCCAPIRNRGLHYASNHIKKILVRDRKNTKYCLKLDIKKFNKEYPILKVAKTNKFHDRFIIIDNKEMYHLGASIKDLGKKCFGINKIEDMEIIEKIINL